MMKSIDKVLTVISILLVSVLIIGVITFMLPDGFWNKIADTLGYWSEYHQAINNIEIYEEFDIYLSNGTIQKGEQCKIYSWQYNGKLMSAHKISCQNGLAGYISIGDLKYFPTFNK